MYMYIDYLSTAAQRDTAPQVKINLTLLQYRTAVVVAGMAIRALHQRTATQLQWTMNAS